jgi:flavin reductase (DIM6/NTAB) family NADH-FMN oxidoreductase RutF
MPWLRFTDVSWRIVHTLWLWRLDVQGYEFYGRKNQSFADCSAKLLNRRQLVQKEQLWWIELNVQVYEDTIIQLVTEENVIVIVESEKIDSESLYRILIGSVLPRPIAWVSTLSADGKPNLAPFSFFTVASANPPVVCFSPGLKGELVEGKLRGVPKDTLKNIQETKEFVVNIVSHKVAEKMVQTSGDYAYGVSEFEAAGLTAIRSRSVKPFCVGESLINMECTLRQVLEFGDEPGSGNLVLGNVVCIHIDDSVYDGRHIDIDVLQPIGRLGGNEYCTTRDRFVLLRPQIR